MSVKSDIIAAEVAMNSIFYRKKKSFSINAVLLASIAIFSIITGIYISIILKKVPSEIYILNDSETTIDLNIPVTGECILVENASKIDFSEPVTFIGNEVGQYDLKIRLFDLFDLKTVSVNVVSEQNVYPGGFQIGMYFSTDGIFVVDTGEITDYAGNKINPCENILKCGDYITAINGTTVYSKTQLNKLINENKDKSAVLSLRRGDENINVSITPVFTSDGDYKMGIWVKDDAQGIGTVTYITADNRFGALGHGISDGKSASLLQISSGSIYRTRIMSIIKGSNGKPGEFIGFIDYNDENILGNIENNTNCGIYGNINHNIINEYQLDLMNVGFSYEVHTGQAKIRIYDEKNYNDYDIEITDIRNNDTKNLTFKVTSSELLEKTNGIIQGMSGSPIIQDNKIIGAVTHVFIDDSTKGYGIFIENMLEH